MPVPPCNQPSLRKIFAPVARRSGSRLTGIFYVLLFGLLTMFFAAPALAQINEGFDASAKAAYAANATLSSGSRHLDDALTGNLSDDAKIGSCSARVRNSGKVRLNFDLANAGTVAVTHAVYGADDASNWELWQSAEAFRPPRRRFRPLILADNTATSVRFEIRKASGSDSA